MPASAAEIEDGAPRAARTEPSAGVTRPGDRGRPGPGSPIRRRADHRGRRQGAPRPRPGPAGVRRPDLLPAVPRPVRLGLGARRRAGLRPEHLAPGRGGRVRVGARRSGSLRRTRPHRDAARRLPRSGVHLGRDQPRAREADARHAHRDADLLAGDRDRQAVQRPRLCLPADRGVDPAYRDRLRVRRGRSGRRPAGVRGPRRDGDRARHARPVHLRSDAADAGRDGRDVLHGPVPDPRDDVRGPVLEHDGRRQHELGLRKLERRRRADQGHARRRPSSGSTRSPPSTT